VRGQRGGTQVTHVAVYLHCRPEEMRDGEDTIRARGGQPGGGWLEYKEALPDPRTRETLLPAPEEGALMIHKVFLADGTPVIHCVDYLPLHLIQKPFS
jgi:DNA-binding GntR family transcriptional regulator